MGVWILMPPQSAAHSPASRAGAPLLLQAQTLLGERWGHTGRRGGHPGFPRARACRPPRAGDTSPDSQAPPVLGKWTVATRLALPAHPRHGQQIWVRVPAAHMAGRVRGTCV